ncbi:MAG: 6-bladed beta-propeller [Gemmatimonadota bacterium]
MSRIDSTAVGAAVAAALLLGALPASAQRVIDLPGTDRALPGAPADVWAVGTAMGRDWEQLNGVAAMAFDARDNLYVVDSGNFRVLRFDAAGRFVRQLGSQGGGPGEFSLPRGVAVTTDGAVVVADMMGGYEVFDSAGAFVRAVPYPGDMRSVQRLAAHPREGVVASSMAAPVLRPGGDMSALRQPIPVRVFQQPVRADAQLTVLHEHNDPPPQVETSSAGGQRVMMRVGPGRDMFAPAFSWGVLPDGRVATLNGAAYAIRINDAHGAHVATLQRPLEPRPVTERIQRQAQTVERARFERGDAGAGGVSVTVQNGVTSFGSGGGAAELTPQQLDERVAALTFAAVVPAARRMITDPQGRIWVERYAADFTEPGPVDLLTADGRYLGTLRDTPLPAAVSASGLAAWLERDELGVERVVVRRLPGGW